MKNIIRLILYSTNTIMYLSLIMYYKVELWYIIFVSICILTFLAIYILAIKEYKEEVTNETRR